MPVSFRVKDLLINVVPKASAFVRGSDVGLVGPDQDITDFPPTITPVINVALQSPRFQAVHDLGLKNLSLEGYQNLAADVGRAVLAGVFLCSQDMPTCEANQRISPLASGGQAYCTDDMPTCSANERISPVASGVPTLRFEDLAIAKELMAENINLINEVEEKRLNHVRRNADEYVSLMEEAISEIKHR